MIILGINNMHDASSALLAENRIVAAAEEERFRRIKHIKGFPKNAIRYCLEASNIPLRDMDVVAASWRPWVLSVRAALAVKSILASPKIFQAKASRGMKQIGNEWKELFLLNRVMQRHFEKGRYRIRYVEHHLAHAASAYLCSPFEESAILTVDGAGEEESTVTWLGRGTSITKLNSVRLPHSLGQLYSATTAFLGFKVHHDEYKVMGLAANGTPRYADYLLKNVGTVLPDGRFKIKPYFLDYHLSRRGGFSDEVIGLFGEPRRRDEEITGRHADVAASIQRFLEQMLFSTLRALYASTKSRNLCLAGGVALNCVANGKIYDHTPFEQIFVQPAAGDNGTALGAALYIENEGKRERCFSTLKQAYLGPSFSLAQCETALKRNGVSYEALKNGALIDQTVRLLADGNVVGWFQGRMEWGPRALGARSLLADPRRAEIKESINRIIKKREPFRPFAPSVLEEHAPEYFEGYRPSPFMLFTFPVRRDKLARIPAVVHTDKTARPQGVTKDSCPRYYELIDAFFRLTSIPMVLNTSFNVQEPIVCTPDDAIATFLSSEMDYLVMEDFLVYKNGIRARA